VGAFSVGPAQRVHQDAYIRPSVLQSTKAIGVRLHDLENELYIITVPFGDYIDTTPACG